MPLPRPQVATDADRGSRSRQQLYFRTLSAAGNVPENSRKAAVEAVVETGPDRPGGSECMSGDHVRDGGRLAIAGSRSSEPYEHAFFQGMMLLATLIILWGFAPSFFLRGIVPLTVPSYLDPPPQPIRWLYIAHGVVFSAWVALVLSQVALVATGRTAVHRRLGRIAFVLAPCMVAIGLAATAYATRNGFHDVSTSAITFSTVPVADLALFGAFVTAGLVFRRQPQIHKRWMLFAMIAIAEAGWERIDILNPGRLPPWFSTELALLVPIAVWDLMRRGRLHVVTIRGGVAMAGTFSLRLWVGSTPAWHALVTALGG